MTRPRDPRARRHTADLVTAAASLEAGADAMRIDHRRNGPALTAQQFADALSPIEPEPRVPVDDPHPHVGRGGPPVAESPAPPPVAPVPPTPPAAAPADCRCHTLRPGESCPAHPFDPTAYKPAAFSSERSLDWVSRHDPRSLAYGVRARLAGSAPVTDRMWPVGPVLDQGTDGGCVGFAVADAVNTTIGLTAGSVLRPAGYGAFLGAADAEAIYHRAQQLDTVPGESYTGTSVLAGMQAAVEAGLFGGYLWAFGTRDVAQAVLQRGPVVVGVPWRSGMYDTGPGGLVQVTGGPAGGHCLAVVGIRMKGPQGQAGPFFVWQNSYGPGYGDDGLGYIHHRDLAELLHHAGEAAIPTAEPVR